MSLKNVLIGPEADTLPRLPCCLHSKQTSQPEPITLATTTPLRSDMVTGSGGKSHGTGEKKNVSRSGQSHVPVVAPPLLFLACDCRIVRVADSSFSSRILHWTRSTVCALVHSTLRVVSALATAPIEQPARDSRSPSVAFTGSSRRATTLNESEDLLPVSTLHVSFVPRPESAQTRVASRFGYSLPRRRSRVPRRRSTRTGWKRCSVSAPDRRSRGLDRALIAIVSSSDNRKVRIIPRHLQLAIKNDEELDKLLGHVIIQEGTLVPVRARAASSQADLLGPVLSLISPGGVLPHVR